MPVPELITSLQNPKVKEAVSLGYRSDVRRERGLFLVEGRREVQRCLAAGFRARCIFWCPELLPEDEFRALANRLADARPHHSASLHGSPSYDAEGGTGLLRAPSAHCKVFGVSRAVYEKIAYRGGTEGVIAEVEWREFTLADLKSRLEGRQAPLIMVLEAVEKPGNLGAVLRSADAAGADAVIVCDPLTDIYNPNVIRASVGGIFTVTTVCCSSEEAINWLKDNGIQILTAQLQDSSLYYDRDMTVPTAIVMGTESTGLSTRWREAADAHIRIPMLGVEDSLNVSVSAAILLFEAVRQRRS